MSRNRARKQVEGRPVVEMLVQEMTMLTEGRNNLNKKERALLAMQISRIIGGASLSSSTRDALRPSYDDMTNELFGTVKNSKVLTKPKRSVVYAAQEALAPLPTAQNGPAVAPEQGSHAATG